MGAIAAFLSALFSTSKDLVSKRVASDVDGATSAFASFAYALPFYGICFAVGAAWQEQAWYSSPQIFLLVFLRALTDTFAELTKMYAFSYADISLVASLLSLTPLLLLVVSPLVTGDPLGGSDILAMFLISAGSFWLVYKTPSVNPAQQRKGIIFALLAAIFFSLNSSLDRLAVQSASPVFSGFSMTLLSGLMLLPAVFRRDRAAKLAAQHRPFLLRGFFEVAFMVSKLYALQFLDAPKVMGIQRSSLLFSIVGGRVMFHERDFVRRFICGMMVFGGILIILFA